MNIYDKLQKIGAKLGTPLYIYDKQLLIYAAQELVKAKMPYGLTVRYAVKANPHPEIIKIFANQGLHFDASSTYEAQYLVEQGVQPGKISLSGQSLKGPLTEVLEAGVLPVATSLRQMEVLGGLGVKNLAIRVNPGMGSGHSNRTNVGGPASSFGIWHEYVQQAAAFAVENGMTIDRLHTHIGSGANPDSWPRAIELSLAIVEQLRDVIALDIGGGYKVARMPGEPHTDMEKEVFQVFREALVRFKQKTGRELHLEIEPGTMLVANSGYLVAEVEDIVDTGDEGYTFLRVNTGMNDILRPSLYGAQHPIKVLNDSTDTDEYVVVGHNCESGDILTPADGDPEGIQPRELKKAKIGDMIAIGGAGAYCASMRAKSMDGIGYNGFPCAPEIIA